MAAVTYKRTKIIASIGPASLNPKTIEDLIVAGVNGVRLNFSHGDHAEKAKMIKWARLASKNLDKPIAIIADLQGPKIRVGDLAEGVVVKRGETIRLAYKADYTKTGKIPIQYDLSKIVKAGEPIFIHDGRLELRVQKITGPTIAAKVNNDGIILARKGINVPESNFKGSVLTPQDLSDIEFISKNDVDYVAQSFVQDAGDIKRLRAHLNKTSSDIRIIAKIETKAATQHIPQIIEASDGVMVARGDLAIEAGAELVPVLQRQIIGQCQQAGKVAIVATQMLASMTQSPTPTRAEVSDIATAVNAGADCVMLSDETAVGKYPVQAVRMMKKVSLYTEKHFQPEVADVNPKDGSWAIPISDATIKLAKRLNARAIIAETATGQTARNIAAHRPAMPIIMATTNRRVAQQLAIMYGGKAFYFRSARRAGIKTIDVLKKRGFLTKGDVVVITYGKKPGAPGGTDTIKVRQVE